MFMFISKYRKQPFWLYPNPNIEHLGLKKNQARPILMHTKIIAHPNIAVDTVGLSQFQYFSTQAGCTEIHIKGQQNYI